MNLRQAILMIALFALLLGPSACSASNEIPATVTFTPPPPTATLTPSPIPPTATPTPLGCLTEPGKVELDVVKTTNPEQEFLIYLPPCYEEFTDTRYPVLYLLHGQTYGMDQWVRLGVSQLVDQMISSGESVPFIVVFPNDEYWNMPAGTRFGERLLDAIIPYVDSKYRTLPNRENRALGGLSRGGGWTAQLGFENPGLFGSLGLHSPAVFKGDGYYIEKLARSIPADARPRLWLDVGDNDREWKSIIAFEQMLASIDYPHEYHLYLGDHSEIYWSAHVREYLQWYAEAWNAPTEGE